MRHLPNHVQNKWLAAPLSVRGTGGGWRGAKARVRSVNVSQSMNVLGTLQQRKTHFIAMNYFKIAWFQSGGLYPAFGNMAGWF